MLSDRWHRVTYHSGGALCLASTPFSLEHRGAFAVTGSKTYVRIKALHYTEDNLVGLHDLGQSRVTDENGKDVEVLNVSLDPTMECRPLPCKLRYSMEVAISSMARVEGRSCYLILGYKDSRIQIFEERGKGTGKLDSVGWIEDCHPSSEIRPVTGLLYSILFVKLP
ncbi:unnamed protein product [Strongylus vulgaris]|uniref:Uncharacterized protein n=1 Tax=Strongylus vulgaris TaxID=40348 RepID=A0A3P7KC89_STRVU|nr:unnamed protein product [Strongylus vulgaris]